MTFEEKEFVFLLKKFFCRKGEGNPFFSTNEPGRERDFQQNWPCKKIIKSKNWHSKKKNLFFCWKNSSVEKGEGNPFFSTNEPGRERDFQQNWPCKKIIKSKNWHSKKKNLFFCWKNSSVEKGRAIHFFQRMSLVGREIFNRIDPAKKLLKVRIDIRRKRICFFVEKILL